MTVSLLLLAGDIIRFVAIFKDTHMHGYQNFITTIYGILDILFFTTYTTLFVSCVRAYTNKSKNPIEELVKKWQTCKYVIITLPIGVLIFITYVLSFAAPIIQAHHYVTYLNGNNQTVEEIIVTSDQENAVTADTKGNISVILIGISVFLIGVTCSIIVTFFLGMVIYYGYNEWSSSKHELYKKLTFEYPAADSVNNIDSLLQEHLQYKLCSLYKKYAEIGERTEMIRLIFQNWFVVQYLVFLLAILAELANIVAKSTKDGVEDVVSPILYLIYNIIHFFIAYYTANWYNSLHHDCYVEMKSALIQLRVKKQNQKIDLNLGSNLGNFKDTYYKYFANAIKANFTKRNVYPLTILH